MKKILKNAGVQSFLASIICIILGLLIGFIALLIIEPSGAVDGIVSILKNFFGYSRTNLQIKYMGNTLVSTAPLIMCSLSIIFAYKVGMFNIGCSGQYTMGILACLYGALVLGWGWFPCMVVAAIAGALYGALVGVLKSYLNVNEVISGIMLNWIALYVTNLALSGEKNPNSTSTFPLKNVNASAIFPSLGLENLFEGNDYVGLALVLALVFSIIIWIVLDKTKLGYELRATGNNKNAAKYAGMAEKKNIILTLAISGALAGLAASFLYQTDIAQWDLTSNSVPNMGFNGIAAGFLGGLNPIGAIFASFFIEHITEGGGHLDLNFYCAQVSDLIAAIIIYFCGFVGFIKYAMAASAAKADKKIENNAEKGETN